LVSLFFKIPCGHLLAAISMAKYISSFYAYKKMKRSRAKGRLISGMWIPILLLAGIPGTAMYALFRIGDAVAEAKKN
jgi:hypothetical protein